MVIFSLSLFFYIFQFYYHLISIMKFYCEEQLFLLLHYLFICLFDFIYIYIQIYISVAHGCLLQSVVKPNMIIIYSLAKIFHLWPLGVELLLVGSCMLGTSLTFKSISLLSGTRIILNFSCLSPEIKHFSRNIWFLLLKNHEQGPRFGRQVHPDQIVTVLLRVFLSLKRTNLGEKEVERVNGQDFIVLYTPT